MREPLHPRSSHGTHAALIWPVHSVYPRCCICHFASSTFPPLLFRYCWVSLASRSNRSHRLTDSSRPVSINHAGKLARTSLQFVIRADGQLLINPDSTHRRIDPIRTESKELEA